MRRSTAQRHTRHAEGHSVRGVSVAHRTSRPPDTPGEATDGTDGRAAPTGRVLAASALIVGLALYVVPDVGAATERMSLEDANHRWRGAQCRSREPIALTGEVERDGTALSRWIAWLRPGVTNPNAPPAALGQFRFSNGDALLRRYRGASIPPRATFTAVGWGEEERGGAVYLEVALPHLPVMGRLFFYTPKPPGFRRELELRRLADCERWARFEVFEILETPDEQLEEVGSGQVATPPLSAAPPAAPPPNASASTQVFDPAVTLHAVAVQPAQVAPGGEVLLVLTYEISGVPAGARVEVRETRRLMDGDRELAAFPEQVVRGPGPFTSKLPVRVPTGMAPGMYSVRATVELAGLSAVGTAFFEVRHDPS